MMQSKKKKHCMGKTVCTDNDKKNCLSPNKFYPPPPQKKTIMVLFPYLLTTSIAFNFVFKKAKASLLSDMYSKLRCVIRSGDKRANFFSFDRGQGCILSPLLFNLYNMYNIICLRKKSESM